MGTIQTALWESGFAALLLFRAREGHCSPARKYVEDKFNLGSWVATQRYYYHRGFLLAERKRQLDAVGFVWDPLNDRWAHGFAALLKFKKRTGHCRAAVFANKDFVEGFASKFRPLVMTQEVKLLQTAPWGPHP